MAKIVDYKKDLPILNKQLQRVDDHAQKLIDLEARIRKMEALMKQLVV